MEESIKKKIIMGVIMTVIAGVFGVIIYFVTKQFQSTCSAGEFFDSSRQECRVPCGADSGCDPTKDQKCSFYDGQTKECRTCQPNHIFNTKTGGCVAFSTPATKQYTCELTSTPTSFGKWTCKFNPGDNNYQDWPAQETLEDLCPNCGQECLSVWTTRFKDCESGTLNPREPVKFLSKDAVFKGGPPVCSTSVDCSEKDSSCAKGLCVPPDGDPDQQCWKINPDAPWNKLAYLTPGLSYFNINRPWIRRQIDCPLGQNSCGDSPYPYSSSLVNPWTNIATQVPCWTCENKATPVKMNQGTKDNPVWQWMCPPQ